MASDTIEAYDGPGADSDVVKPLSGGGTRAELESEPLLVPVGIHASDSGGAPTGETARITFASMRDTGHDVGGKMTTPAPSGAGQHSSGIGGTRRGGGAPTCRQGVDATTGGRRDVRSMWRDLPPGESVVSATLIPRYFRRCSQRIGGLTGPPVGSRRIDTADSRKSGAPGHAAVGDRRRSTVSAAVSLRGDGNTAFGERGGRS